MLNAIKKKFFNAASAEKEAVDMKQETPQPNLAASDTAAQLATALDSMAKQAADLQALTELVTEMSEKFNAASMALETTQAALQASEDAKVALVAQAAAARLEARSKAVVDAIGTEKAPALLAATEQLGDEQFNAIVGAMAQSFEKEAQSPLFKEVGVSASADPVEVDPVAKLAASLAAQFQQTK